MTVPEGVAAAAAVWAVLQVALASRRDLGALTVGLAGVAALVADAPTPPLVALLGVAVVAGALGWARGGRHGVGRVALVGVSLATVSAALLVRWALPFLWPGETAQAWATVSAVPCVLVAATATAVALERPGPRRVVLRFYRRVPVQ